MGAGISHWYLGRFDLYRVNPPLVRMLATLPVALARPATSWRSFHADIRSEWEVGGNFIEDNGPQAFWYFTLARWACIPLSVVGGYFCFRWAVELYGQYAGILALILWCFCPNILAHGQMITPDAGAAALGVLAGYCFWRWLRQSTWSWTLWAGVALGLAELAKATWIILFLLWPLLWLIWRALWRRETFRSVWPQQAVQLGLILLLGLYLINLGYGFEGSYQKLGDYRFLSKTLQGPDNDLIAGSSGNANRFAHSWIGMIPVPLPKNYLLGIDLQRKDFEQEKTSYLRGQWQEGGWWYYYLYGLAIKVPLGTWTLVLLVILLRTCRLELRARWPDELILLGPLLAILILVSSQTGFSRHLRYVLPILPFGFIWTSQIAQSFAGTNRKIAALVVAAMSWSVGSSLWVYPHSLSYFNELVGGPVGGHAHVVDSNIDWGQDLFFLKRWLDEHPEARPLWLDVFGILNPAHVGIEASPPPSAPTPGWYAISVHQLRGQPKYAFLLQSQPEAMAGYSIYIYHIGLEEANRVRRELGLNQLAIPTDCPPTEIGMPDMPVRPTHKPLRNWEHGI